MPPPYCDQPTSSEYRRAALLELQEQARALGCEVVTQGHLDVLAKERRYLIAEVDRLRGCLANSVGVAEGEVRNGH
jgi:hypothetical protein